MVTPCEYGCISLVIDGDIAIEGQMVLKLGALMEEKILGSRKQYDVIENVLLDVGWGGQYTEGVVCPLGTSEARQKPLSESHIKKVGRIKALSCERPCDLPK